MTKQERESLEKQIANAQPDFAAAYTAAEAKVQAAVEAEREACAKIVWNAVGPGDNPHDRLRLEELAADIRARGNA